MPKKKSLPPSTYTFQLQVPNLNASEYRSKDGGPVKLWDKDMKKVVKTFQLGKDDCYVVKSICRIKVHFHFLCSIRFAI